MASGGEATIFNEELWWGVGRKASLGPEISTVMHSFDQADDEGGEKSERCRAGLPPRGPLSGGLASWEFASLPPPASYTSFNPVLSEVSKAGASGQGENRKGNAGAPHCCGLGVAG